MTCDSTRWWPVRSARSGKSCKWFEPYWASIGRLLLIKGPKWVDERAEARERGLLKQLELRRAAVYPLEGTHAESVILQLARHAAGRIRLRSCTLSLYSQDTSARRILERATESLCQVTA